MLARQNGRRLRGGKCKGNVFHLNKLIIELNKLSNCKALEAIKSFFVFPVSYQFRRRMKSLAKINSYNCFSHTLLVEVVRKGGTGKFKVDKSCTPTESPTSPPAKTL